MSGLDIEFIDFTKLPQPEREKVIYENILEINKKQVRNERLQILQLGWMAVLTAALGAQKLLEVFRW